MRATRALAVVYVVVLSLVLAGCGPEPGPTSARAVAAAVAPDAIGVWDDALVSGWTDWSWGSTRRSTTSPVASGSAALSVTFNAWGGLYFRRSSTSVSGMSILELQVNGGSTAGSKLQVHAVQGSTDLAPVALEPYCAGGTIPANAWTRCKAVSYTHLTLPTN